MYITALTTTSGKHEGIFLDTGCSSHWFHDKDMFESLTPCKVRIKGIGGIVTATHKGMTRFGMAYFGNTSLNLLSPNQIHRDNKLKSKTDEIHIRYNHETNSFSVHSKDIPTLQFETSNTMNIPYDNNTRIIWTKREDVALQGINEPPDCTSTHPRIIKEATNAILLHFSLNHPSDEALCRTLDNGGLRHTTVTSNHVRNARRIFGICPGCSAGKATNATTGGQYNTANKIAQHLHSDIVFVPTLKGGTALYHLSSDEYCTDIRAHSMDNQYSDSIHKAQVKVINHYRSHGHNVETMYYDHGSNITATETKLNGLGIKLDQAPPKQHDKHAESAYRTVKSMMRAVISSLKFRLPIALLKLLLQDVCTTRSMVCTTNSGAQTPYQLIRGGTSVDVSKVLKLPFGCLVQYHDDDATGLGPRIAYGIITGRDILNNSTYSIYQISTRTHVRRNVDSIKQLPLNDTIVNIINRIHDEEPYAFDDILYKKGNETNPHDHVMDNVINQHKHTRVTKSSLSKATPKLTKGSSTNTEPSEHRSYKPNNREERAAKKAAAEKAEAEDNHEGETINDTVTPDDTITADNENNNDITDIDDTTVDDITHIENTETATFNIANDKDPFHGLRPEEIALAQIILGNTKFITNIVSTTEMALAHLSLNQMMNQKGPEGIASAVKEATQILDRNTWTPRHAHTLTAEQKSGALPCHAIGQQKHDDSLKSRILANGKFQDKMKPEYSNMVSPTSSHMTTMIHLAVASYEQRPFISQIDYPGAYLGIDRSKHNMPEELMRVSGKLAQLIISVDPTYKEYEVRGSFYVSLDKSLYGLVESAALWYKEVSEHLDSLGYRRSLVDPCLFHEKNGLSSINIHVDDFLCSFKTVKEKQRVHDFFKSKNCTIKEQDLTFLNMHIQLTSNGITLDMENYIDKHLDKWGVNGTAPYPASKDLFEISEMSDKATDPKRFTSIVMALMYLALRARPDILLATSFLSTRCHKCTVQDESKLDTLLRYLRGTSQLKITINPKIMHIVTYADASYNVHADAKGHNGFAVTIGSCGALIAAKSTKQKATSQSSCEAELIAAHASTAQTIQAAQTLAEFGYTDIPTLQQDNEGTITLAHNGSGSYRKTKHINTRYFSIKELIESNRLDLEHCRTEDMPADVLTKPLTGHKFIKFRKMLMNII